MVNSLEVVPPEEDSDDEVADALRLVLEKDPLVLADQIRAGVSNWVVTLEGLVGGEEEKNGRTRCLVPVCRGQGNQPH